MFDVIQKETNQPLNCIRVTGYLLCNDLPWLQSGPAAIKRNGPPLLQRPPVNIRQTASAYEMELLAPGLEKQDFKLQVMNGKLEVSFESGEEENNSRQIWIRQEFRRQSFTRSFPLPDSVDTSKISARYENGVLFITLPQKEDTPKNSNSIVIK